MEYTVKSGDPEKQRSACVVIGLYEGRKLSPSGKRLDEAAQGGLTTLLRRGDIDGKAGQTLLLQNPAGLLCARRHCPARGRDGAAADHAAPACANGVAAAGADLPAG